MEFAYFEPSPALQELVGSYYFVSLPFELSDIMRAEIANVRFVLDGGAVSDLSGAEEHFSAGDSLLCGPTYKWSHVKFLANSRIFGASITPLGWRKLFGFNAEDAADLNVPFQDVVPAGSQPLIEKLHAAKNNKEIVEAADALFMSMVSDGRRIHDDFIHNATEWIVDPEPNEIEHLLERVEFSHRQVERLCKAYFGSGPKKLHRKFRALHAANRLTWYNLTDWREAARAAYYDQAHFIREFKQFNGHTPQDFIKGPKFLVRMTLEERLKISHRSPFSLVG